MRCWEIYDSRTHVHRKTLYPNHISHIPSQDEYQHALEFAHDGNSNGNSNRKKTNSSGTTDYQKKTALNGTGVLKGTGSRGRTLAVAADRKRAERTLRNDSEHSWSDKAGDVRDAQRARRIMQMQKQIQEGGQQQRSASTAGLGCGGGGSGRGGGPTATGAINTSTAPKRVRIPWVTYQYPFGSLPRY